MLFAACKSGVLRLPLFDGNSVLQKKKPGKRQYLDYLLRCLSPSITIIDLYIIHDSLPDLGVSQKIVQ